MAKKKPQPKTLHGGLIARGTKAFIAVKETGEIGDNGKVVMRIGYSGRIESNDEYPLASLLVPVLKMVVPSVRYADKAAFDKDLSVLKGCLERLEYNP